MGPGARKDGKYTRLTASFWRSIGELEGNKGSLTMEKKGILAIHIFIQNFHSRGNINLFSVDILPPLHPTAQKYIR
jgi:hypothetical protein